MSVLDQLLIKAYQHDPPSRPGAPHAKPQAISDAQPVAVAKELYVEDEVEVPADQAPLDSSVLNAETPAFSDSMSATRENALPVPSLAADTATATPALAQSTDADPVGMGFGEAISLALPSKETPNPIPERKQPEIETAVIDTVAPSDSQIELPRQAETSDTTTINDAEQKLAEIDEAEQAIENLDQAASEQLPAVDNQFRAAWEVDRFEWPDLCDRVTQELRSDLDQFSATLPAGKTALMMVATRPEAGTTTVSLCIAKHLAAGNSTVAIVDANLTNQGLTKALRVAVEAGIETVLSGINAAEDIAIRAIDENIVLIPGHGAVDLSGGKAIDRLAELTVKLGQKFDVVLIDADTQMCNIICELKRPFPAKAVVVNRSNDSDRSEVEATTQMLREANFAMFGIVENFIGPVDN